MLSAKDVMTTPVVSVASTGTVGLVADLLVRHRISAIPVIDDGKLVGIVSEGDLLRRAEIGTEPRHHRSWWLDLFADNASLAAEYTKSHSVKVADVMTRNVVTVTEVTPLADIADLLEEEDIKRVPVMRFGEVVGVVSRANLVQALAVTSRAGVPAPASRDDAAIRSRLMAALKAEPWVSFVNTNVMVENGVVTFWGAVASEEERKATEVLGLSIEGVCQVEDHRRIVDFAVVAV